jgi:hypothetical protein
MAKRTEPQKVIKFNPQPETGDPILPTLPSMQAHLERLYKQSTRQGPVRGVNFLCGGGMGTGKTVALETLPKPTLIHSFDPDGTESIDPALIKSGAVMVNKIFEEEFSPKPAAYRRWFNEFNYLRAQGVFDLLGSYAIDSATMFGEAALNYAMFTAGRPAQIPQQRDYLAQIMILQAMFKYVCSTSCHVVINFHLEDVENEDGKLIGKDFLITGKARIRIPILFSEVYCMTTQMGPDERLRRVFVTQPYQYYQARTRMGRAAGFNVFEWANYKELLKKGGKPYEDKPLLTQEMIKAMTEGAAEATGSG